MAKRKGKSRRITRYVPKIIRRRAGGLGGVRNIVKGALLGLGALEAYRLIASKVSIPVPPMIGAAAAGYIAGGVVPAITAAAAEYITESRSTSTPSKLEGNIWV